jgi:hypothetical protein
VRGAAILVALTLLAGCGPGRLVRHGQINEDALAVVRRTLPAIRALAFTAPVPALAMGRAELADALAHEVNDSYRPGDIEHLEAVYRRLGLLAPGTALRPALERLYEEEGAGFYDPRRKRLVLATHALRAAGFWVDLLASVTGRDLVGEFLVAHELTHALQDQHYGLPTDPEPLTDSHGDALLARHALLEGDATLAGFAYALGGSLDADTIDWIERRLRVLPAELATRYPDVPEVVRATLAFEYDDGTAFTGWALAAGGWRAVDRAEADPPASTEQVLHPARYFATRDRPVPIALGGTDALEATGWGRTLEDTLGELQIRILARRVLPASQAVRVADGWGGDRLRALARGEDLQLIWMTAWDSPAQAVEFADAVPAMLAGAWCERREDRVLVLLGPPTAGGDPGALAAGVWRGTISASAGRHPPPPR